MNAVGKKSVDPMHGSHIHWKVAHDRYSAKSMAKPVNFVCVAPKAKQVTIAGDFNHWDAQASPMTRQPDGAWMAQLQLNHGHHEYVFHVDGLPTLDPKAQGIARDRHGNRVSMIPVS